MNIQCLIVRIALHNFRIIAFIFDNINLKRSIESFATPINPYFINERCWRVWIIDTKLSISLNYIIIEYLTDPNEPLTYYWKLFCTIRRIQWRIFFRKLTSYLSRLWNCLYLKHSHKPSLSIEYIIYKKIIVAHQCTQLLQIFVPSPRKHPQSLVYWKRGLGSSLVAKRILSKVVISAKHWFKVS